MAIRSHNVITLSAIPAIKIHEVWDRVRPGLEMTKAKTNDRWLPEDVYHELRTGTHILFMVDLDEEEVGFMVCKEWQDFDGKALFVWILCIEPGAIGIKNYREMLEKVDDLAHRAGAKRIRMYSPRNWDDLGMFELKQHIFEREV
jgi:hypothetical protein